MQSYRRAVNSGRAQLVSATEMEKQFENTEHMIIMYGQVGSLEHEWQTVSFFGGRYELTMSVRVGLNTKGDSISVIEAEPTFLLTVCREIRDGGADYHSSRQHSFGLAKWKEFKQSGYDMRILDPKFDKSELPGFDEYAEEWQRNRRVWR